METERRVILLEEVKNGSFRCRDGSGGPEFGRAATLPDALQVSIEYLTMQGFEGEGAIMVRPWHTRPVTQELLTHSFKQGEITNLWKPK